MHNNYFAAVDMGTNSFHLIIVKVNKDGSFKIEDREREVIRLGSVKGEDLSFITEEEMEHAISILKNFKKLAKVYNADLTAIATSAVREAKNKKEFIEKVYDETGIKVEAIEGRKEAKLIYLGVQKALSTSDKKVLCIDIGGGSTEFILGDNGETIFAESVKIGAVRLTKKFFSNFILTDASINECEKYIEKEIISNENINLNESYELAVGSSGTIQAAASMIFYAKNDYNNKSLNNTRFTYNELKQITEQVLIRKTNTERLAIPGMEEKRADIIPAGLLILSKAFELFKIKEITISEYALREGIIIYLLNQGKKTKTGISI